MPSARGWFLAAVTLYALVWAWSWTRLPERVPTHFGVGGEPDDWSSRGAALVSTGLLGLGTALLFVVGRTVWMYRRRYAIPSPV